MPARLRGAEPRPDDIASLVSHWRDGRIKQALIARTLAVRARRPELFTAGSYEPLAISGTHAARVIGFVRRGESSIAVTLVPRIAARLLQGASIAAEPARWADTAFALQHDLPLIDVFSGRTVEAARAPITVGKLFERLPFALLVSLDLVP